jgi:hypothetical protein
VNEGSVDYKRMQESGDIRPLMDFIAQPDLSFESSNQKKAYYINVYNIAVIDRVLDYYPTSSVMKHPGFFEQPAFNFGGTKMSLNRFEKEIIFESFPDPRLHFVLVCAAHSCPALASFAFKSELLEAQLNGQLRSALQSRRILDSLDSKVMISKLFDWYATDFGGSKEAILQFINTYLETPLNINSSISYLEYNWRLNDLDRADTSFRDSAGPSGARYVVSAAIPQGQWEIKLFNNLYSQSYSDGGNQQRRDGFFTQTLNVLYGLNSRFNIGVSTRYRRTRIQLGESHAFDVLASGPADFQRAGLTGIGPQIRFAPFKKLRNFSIQSTFIIPTQQNLEGEDGRIFIDWSAPSWQTQFFNDFALNKHFSVFAELDFFLEDIGSFSRFSTPATIILSYFPVRNVTIYALGSYSPYWQSNYDYFHQYGLGTKFQFNPNFEIEMLWTKFQTQFLADRQGSAATYNLGLRFNL